MITIGFYSVKERKPKNKESIVLLVRERHMQIFDGVRVVEGTVEYSLEEMDEEGNDTGVSYNYRGRIPKNCRLQMMFGQHILTDDDHYATHREFFSQAYRVLGK